MPPYSAALHRYWPALHRFGPALHRFWPMLHRFSLMLHRDGFVCSHRIRLQPPLSRCAPSHLDWAVSGMGGAFKLTSNRSQEAGKDLGLALQIATW